MQIRQLQKQHFGTCSCACTALFGSHPLWHQGPYSLLAHRKQHLASTTLQATANSIFCFPCWLQFYFLTLCGSQQHLDSQLLPGNHEFSRTLSSTLPLAPQPTFFTQIRMILLDWLGWPAELNSMVFYQQRGGLHTTREKVAFLKVKSDLNATFNSHTALLI